MNQVELPFFESAEEATKHAVLASGKNLKQVAAALWPDKSAAAAHTLLANCLNENRQERLTADQHIFIANFCGNYAWLRYAAHACHHSQPEPVAPEDEHAKLQREFVAAVQRLGSIQAQLRLNGSRLQVVS